MTTRTKQPNDNLPRVFRSGGWYYATITNVRAAIRGGNAPLLHDDGVGFRTAQTGCCQPLKGANPP